MNCNIQDSNMLMNIQPRKYLKLNPQNMVNDIKLVKIEHSASKANQITSRQSKNVASEYINQYLPKRASFKLITQQKPEGIQKYWSEYWFQKKNKLTNQHQNVTSSQDNTQISNRQNQMFSIENNIKIEYQKEGLGEQQPFGRNIYNSQYISSPDTFYSQYNPDQSTNDVGNEIKPHVEINNRQPTKKLGKWFEEYLEIEQVANIFNDKNQSEESQIDYVQDYQLLFQPINEKQNMIQKPQFFTSNAYRKKEKKVLQQGDEQQKQKQSKFINKNKSLFRKILKFLDSHNMNQILMPRRLRKILKSCIQTIKNIGTQQVNGAQYKSELFNHSHYNVLFMKLTRYTIRKLLNTKHKKEIKLHKHVYGIDLEDQDGYKQEDIEYINFIKTSIFKIIEIHLGEFMLYQTSLENQEQYEYEYRTFNGIQNMINGQYITRF